MPKRSSPDTHGSRQQATGTAEPIAYEEAQATPQIAAVAPQGWRVIIFLRKSPWVREEPVGAFRLSEYFATPMVLDGSRLGLRGVDEKTTYALAAPSEPAEMFVEQAKQHDREHRQWLLKTRDQRRQEKEIRELAWKMHRERVAFEAAGRRMQQGHPARFILRGMSLLWGSGDREASQIALAWFVTEHCELDDNAEMGLDAFKQRLTAFAKAYELSPPDAGTITRSMTQSGFVPVRHGKKIKGWRGLSLRPDAPEEAFLPTPDADEPDFRSTATAVFRMPCIERNDRYGSTASPAAVTTVFRAWCIRYRVKPWSATELIRGLRPFVHLSKGGAGAERVFENVFVRMPRPDQLNVAEGRSPIG